MNEQARRIWKTPEGAGLLRQMLAGGPLDAQVSSSFSFH